MSDRRHSICGGLNSAIADRKELSGRRADNDAAMAGREGLVST